MSFEASLHGLVDDEIDERRRADTLAKLTLSPADTEKLASWRQQNQLLRAAFAGVEAEAVPMALSLVLPPHAVARPFAETRLMAPHVAGRRFAAALCCGLGGIAIFALALWPMHTPPAVDITPVATIATPTDVSNLLRHASTASSPGMSQRIALPDLSRAGYLLGSAEVFDDKPSPIACGTYTAAGRARVVLCAEKTLGDAWPPTDPRVWRHGATLYSLASDDGEAASVNVRLQIRRVMGPSEP